MTRIAHRVLALTAVLLITVATLDAAIAIANARSGAVSAGVVLA